MICSSEKRFFTSNLLALGNWTPNRRATQNQGDVARPRYHFPYCRRQRPALRNAPWRAKKQRPACATSGPLLVWAGVYGLPVAVTAADKPEQPATPPPATTSIGAHKVEEPTAVVVIEVGQVITEVGEVVTHA